MFIVTETRALTQFALNETDGFYKEIQTEYRMLLLLSPALITTVFCNWMVEYFPWGKLLNYECCFWHIGIISGETTTEILILLWRTLIKNHPCIVCIFYLTRVFSRQSITLNISHLCLLQPEGNLLEDRFYSLQKRNIIEPRKRAKSVFSPSHKHLLLNADHLKHVYKYFIYVPIAVAIQYSVQFCYPVI